MCTYTILSKKEGNYIRYCNECKTYNIIFNNLVMNVAIDDIHRLKEDFRRCYERHSDSYSNRGKRKVFFDLKISGLIFLFSINEVATILLMLQEALVLNWGLVEE